MFASSTFVMLVIPTLTMSPRYWWPATNLYLGFITAFKEWDTVKASTPTTSFLPFNDLIIYCYQKNYITGLIIHYLLW